MKYLASFMLFLASICAADAQSRVDSLCYSLMDQAEKAFADDDYSRAADFLRVALSHNPDDATRLLLMSNLGMVYSADGQDSLALLTLDDVLRQAPAMTVARSHRARVRLHVGDDRGAYADYSAVIERDSLSLDARFYHGMLALFLCADDSTALRDFEVLRRVAPKSYDTELAWATYYSHTGAHREAVAAYERLLAYDVAAEYFAAMAFSALSIGDLAKASDAISRGLKLYPADPELYYLRAWLNRDRFRPDDAKADAQRALNLGLDPRRLPSLNL